MGRSEIRQSMLVLHLASPPSGNNASNTTLPQTFACNKGATANGGRIERAKVHLAHPGSYAARSMGQPSKKINKV